jgi:predicted porin
MIFGVAYNYELSKRTSLYCGATYAKGSKGLSKKYNENSYRSEMRADYNGYQFGVGLNHTF